MKKMTGCLPIVVQRRAQGFTLIELMIALIVASIMTLIAINTFSSYVKRSRRIDGVTTIFSIMTAEERYRSNNTQYGTLAQVWGGVTTSPEGYYSLAITNVTATGYQITATAQGNQATDSANGTSCSSLTLTVLNGVTTRAPAVCWPT